jgi:hypothetical protein
MKFLNLFLAIQLLSSIAIAQRSGNEFSFLKDYSQLPIKPERTISFTTDEGSWMDVDVSPDGKTILFDLLGDIYCVPAKGGNARQLTRGIA